MDRLSCDRMFVAVVEAGSFAGGAARQGTSAGQASKLVARLEADLGVRLLNRSTRALALTEAGRAYFDEIRTLIEEFDALDQSIRDVAQRPRGRIRLTAPVTFGAVRLVPALNAFAERYTEISLDVSFTDRLVNLVDEGFDAAVRVGRPADSALIARKLAEARGLVVAAPAYLERHGSPETPDALEKHVAVIDTNVPDPERWRFNGPDGRFVVPVKGRLRYDNAEACLGAAEAGLGIARMPDFVAADSLRAGRVEALLSEWEDEPFGIYALYPPGRHLAAKVRALVDFLADWFARPDRMS